MKRIVIIAAALLTLVGVSAVSATASSASVCEPNGSGCTKAGTYSGPNALVSSDYGGFRLVWTKSVVQPYSSGVPLYWTVWVTYTNIDSSALTLSCPENVTDLSAVQEHMSGGSGDDGTVGGYATTCSNNPGWTATVPPGGTTEVYTTFHNVPWPGSAVAITWYIAGTTAYVHPFQTSTPPPSTKPERQPVWAGYTAYPQNGTVDYVQAEWVVPAVNCGASPQDSRASVWIGMTGSTASIHDKTAWLPQIGTVSQCEGEFPVTAPTYMFTWEMYTTPNQASVHEEYGYTHTNHFHVYGDLPEHYVLPFGTVAYVSALDHIHASVALLRSTASGQRTFEIKLTDLTTGKYAEGVITTSIPVKLGNIVRQGGAIVENGESAGDGLANFGAEAVTDVVVHGGSGGYSFIKWEMENYRNSYATDTSFFEPVAASGQTAFDYTVAWHS
jgi:Peptidase A4 family